MALASLIAERNFMPQLSLLSLLTGNSPGAPGVSAASNPSGSAAPSAFAPVLDKQLRATGLEAAGAAVPLSAMLSLFLQRMVPVTAGEAANEGEAQGEITVSGEKTLLIKIVQLLQQQIQQEQVQDQLLHRQILQQQAKSQQKMVSHAAEEVVELPLTIQQMADFLLEAGNDSQLKNLAEQLGESVERVKAVLSQIAAWPVNGDMELSVALEEDHIAATEGATIEEVAEPVTVEADDDENSQQEQESLSYDAVPPVLAEATRPVEAVAVGGAEGLPAPDALSLMENVAPHVVVAVPTAAEISLPMTALGQEIIGKTPAASVVLPLQKNAEAKAVPSEEADAKLSRKRLSIQNQAQANLAAEVKLGSAEEYEFNNLLSSADKGEQELIQPEAVIGKSEHPQSLQVLREISHKQNFTEVLRHKIDVPVVEQVFVKIRDAVGSDHKQIQIQLDPADLGKVDVKMDVAIDGRTQIVVTADKKDTLEMLQRDRVSLEKSLNDLGLKADAGGMQFNLREQPRDQQQLADQQQQNGRQGANPLLPEEWREEAVPQQFYRGYVSLDEGLNIRV